MNYGKELILDFHGCNTKMFNRVYLELFFKGLCELMDMQREDLYFWDDEGVSEKDCQTNSKTKGTSAVQFILTSNITIHTLDLLGNVYVNIFSCKEFNSDEVVGFCQGFFDGCLVNRQEVERI